MQKTHLDTAFYPSLCQANDVTVDPQDNKQSSSLEPSPWTDLTQSELHLQPKPTGLNADLSLSVEHDTQEECVEKSQSTHIHTPTQSRLPHTQAEIHAHHMHTHRQRYMHITCTHTHPQWCVWHWLSKSAPLFLNRHYLLAQTIKPSLSQGLCQHGISQQLQHLLVGLLRFCSPIHLAPLWKTLDFVKKQKV
jgi:hypothetical protein